MFDYNQNIPYGGPLAAEPIQERCVPRYRAAEPHQNERPVARISKELRVLASAWDAQADKFGRISRQTIQRVDQIAAGRTRTREKQPGMRLVREWAGKTHVVIIDDDGIIHWHDQKWRSLSEVARAITGTRWSGPAFFGLKKRIAK